MSVRIFEIGLETVGINQVDSDEPSGMKIAETTYYKQPFVVKNDSLSALFSGVKCARIILKTYNGQYSCKPELMFGVTDQFGQFDKQGESDFIDIQQCINRIEEYFRDDE